MPIIRLPVADDILPRKPVIALGAAAHEVAVEALVADAAEIVIRRCGRRVTFPVVSWIISSG